MAISDVYMRQPFAPAQDVLQRQDRAFQSLPGLAQQGMQMEAQRAEAQRQQRPVTAWEKALMHMVNGGDPKEAAAIVKAEQGGMPAQGGALGGGMSSNIAVDMPRPIVNRDAPLNVRAMKLGDQMEAADKTGMQRPAMGGALSQAPHGDFTQGMTHRDFNEYIDAQAKIRSMKYHKTISDELELQRLKNQGGKERAEIGAGATVKAAEIGGDVRREIAAEKRKLDTRGLDLREKADEWRKRIAEKKLDEKTANDLAKIQLGYDSLMQKHSEFNTKTSQTDRLEMAKLLVKDANAQEANFAQVEASLAGLVGMDNPDLVEDMKEKRRAVAAAKKQAQEEIKKQKEAAPSGGSTERSGTMDEAPTNQAIVQFPNGRTAPVPLRDLDAALKKYPGAKRIK